MPFNQDLTGQVEPKAKSWQDATPAERRWYYGKVATIAERRKRVELMQAIGRAGVMDPRKRKRSDGADGPVMDPHGGASRTFRLLASSSTERGCMLYWRTNWTTILGYHADGMVRGAPIRDVRLSDAGIAAVQSEGESLWRKRPKATTPKPPPQPPAPKPVPSPVKGETVKTALPKGPLKGPGLIDTRALIPRPAPMPGPKPAPKPAPKPKPAPPPPPVPAPTPIERAVLIARDHGVAIDPAAHELLKYRFPPDQLDKIPAVFLPGPNARILVNEQYHGWAYIEAVAAKSREVNWWSAGHPDQTIHHEIGHALHHREVGYKPFVGTLATPLGPADRALVGREVSRYATTNAGEFVAEVYAGRRAGLVYSEEVMSLYRGFGGPS